MSHENNKYSKEYTEELFWEKIKKFCLAAGKEVIEIALQLYYALQMPSTPAWAKAVIVGALGYFISPIDAIPDVVPVVGYSDDLGALVMALATVSTYITDEIKSKSSSKLEEWFGK